jgi:hypothetical protein
MFGFTTTRRLRAVETSARSEQERLRIRAERAESRAKTAEYNREHWQATRTDGGRKGVAS